jgi:hypothetical protein
VKDRAQEAKCCPRCYEYYAEGTEAEVVCEQCGYRGAPLPHTTEQIERVRAWAEELGRRFGWE